MRILIVEDETDIALGLEDDLKVEGYDIEVVADGVTASRRGREPGWDLILLDVMLPGKDGFEVCRELRRHGVRTPIILLTAKAQEAEKVLGLELGADDYVTKPFSPRELRARIKARLRGKPAAPEETYRFGEMEVDFARAELRRAGEVVEITPIELKLLETFIRRRGRVLTGEQLLEGAWGHATHVTDRAVDAHIVNLRRKIGTSWSLGLTASGALYVFKGISNRDVRIAPIDVKAGKLLGPPASFDRGFVEGAGNPDWSPDGKHLAYAACKGSCLAIRTADTGEVRRLPRSLWYVRFPRWSPDGRFLVAAGEDFNGRRGIFQIDVQTGKATSLVPDVGIGAFPQWSPDGKRIYYKVNRDGDHVYVERDAPTGSERVLIRHATLSPQVSLSPDGQFLVTTRTDTPAKTSVLLLLPISGGEPRELFRVTPPDSFPQIGATQWTPDGRGVVVARRGASRTELWLIPIDGAQARKLDIDVESWTLGATGEGGGDLDRGFSLSPDGRQIAFLTGKSAVEVWALENFLPPSLTSKK